MAPPNPLVYQINPDLLLDRHSQTLEHITDTFLDEVADLGFEYVYVLGVWPSSPGALQHSVTKLKDEIAAEHVRASPFAISTYTPRQDVIGGSSGLEKFRDRLKKRNMLLIVDFVPNHFAVDHEWTASKPELLVQGSDDLLKSEPENYFKVGDSVIAHGRDPFFAGWADTCQLNYASTALRKTMADTLNKISQIADGVRCDMAMLPLNHIFQETWGKVLSLENNLATSDLVQINSDGSVEFKPDVPEFWTSVIQDCKSSFPDFLFVAEVYWDKEWDLQNLGFDFCYDKRLYDRLQESECGGNVKAHLFGGDSSFQFKLVRFLENHDEPRAASTYGSISATNFTQHRAAAIVAYTSRGMRFFHEGQLHGRTKFISMHSGIRPREPLAAPILVFYTQLVRLLRECQELHHGNWTNGVVTASDNNDQSYDSIFASFSWISSDTTMEDSLPHFGNALSTTCVMVLANLSNHTSNGHVRLPDENSFNQSLHAKFGTPDNVVVMSDMISGPASITTDAVQAKPVPVKCFKNTLNEGDRAWFSLQPWETHVFRLNIVPESI